MSDEGGALEPIEDAVRQAVGVEAGAPAWVITATRVGILVACVGGLLGGLNTLGEMWHRWNIHADLQIVPSNYVTMSWDRTRHSLAFQRRIAIQNVGEAIGSVADPPSARLESPVLDAPRDLADVVAQDNNETVAFPLTLGAAQARDVDLRMAPVSTQGFEQDFPKPGVYTLLLRVGSPDTPDPTAYCFELKAEHIEIIEKTGSMRFLKSECPATPRSSFSKRASS